MILKEDDTSITITKSYYKRLLACAWAVQRLKKHLQQQNPTDFYNRAASILLGTLEKKMDIRDFGKERNG